MFLLSLLTIAERALTTTSSTKLFISGITLATSTYIGIKKIKKIKKNKGDDIYVVYNWIYYWFTCICLN